MLFWCDIILLLGGVFLLFKVMLELYEWLEVFDVGEGGVCVLVRFWLVVV